VAIGNADESSGDDRARAAAAGSHEGADARGQARAGETALAASLMPDLSGDLPCGGCGYNLRGLSVRSLCPECGTAVRATILLAVDPHAEELAPLKRPLLTSTALVVLAWAALLSVVGVWAMRLNEALAAAFDFWPESLGLRGPVVFALALSAAASPALIRPHRRVPVSVSGRAAAGVAAYIPLVVLFWFLHARYDPIRLTGYVTYGPASIDRSLLRLAIGGLAAATIWGLWPAATGLIARSVVIRQKRVDTQPISAMLISLGIAASGDMLRLAGEWVPVLRGDVPSILQIVLIAVGSFLFTLTLVGLAVDTIRVRSVLVRPPISLVDVLGARDEREENSGGVESGAA